VELEILYEDNHLIAINKRPSDIVQGDKTGDSPLPDYIKAYLKAKYQKPGNVFCGVIHRLDRPTSGVVLFAKTSKGLERMNKQFSQHLTKKTYWALLEGQPEDSENRLEHFLLKNEKQNKSYCVTQGRKGAKLASLTYKVIQRFERYCWVEITLETGRHHQIRAQFSYIGCPVKGDVKYGAKRNNPDQSICLHARILQFSHPISGEQILIEATPTNVDFWSPLSKNDFVGREKTPKGT
jgi:23S rRNA pseudouridine1911/1915/1917 synthase